MDKGIYFNEQASINTLKLVGELRGIDCQPIADILETMEAKDEVWPLHLDLTTVTFLDSTMLGTLARIAIYYHEQGKTKPKIYHVGHDVYKMFDLLGVESLFEFVDAPCPQSELQILSHDEFAGKPLHDRVIEAHEMLIKIDPSNAVKFKDLLSQLKTKDKPTDE